MVSIVPENSELKWNTSKVRFHSYDTLWFCPLLVRILGSATAPGGDVEVCTLHCTLYIVLMPCTLYSSHCTCRFTCWYTVPVHLCTSAPVHCTCACTCRHMYLTLVPAAHCAAGVWTICVFTSWLFYMESLHRVRIVLAGVLQAGLQVSSSLAFLLAGGQLSHTLCTTVPCILYTVHGVTSSSRYVQEFSLV